MARDDHPVLVIHGVANRSFDDFDRNVQSLEDGLGGPWRLVRVYWGDIAAPVEGIADTVPPSEWSRDAWWGDESRRNGCCP